LNDNNISENDDQHRYIVLDHVLWYITSVVVIVHNIYKKVLDVFRSIEHFFVRTLSVHYIICQESFLAI
jgi:hypothetical protein